MEDVASPEGFARDPALVQRFYNLRRAALATVAPNAAHLALAQLEEELGSDHVLVITQNVDDLHERAGTKNLLHMHGQLLKAKCLRCGKASPWNGDIEPSSICPACGTTGKLRPDIVWFGEMPYHMERIERELSRASVFVSIGTSGRVYPAAGFVSLASYCGAHTIEFNLERSDVSEAFQEHRIGPAGVEVPRWVQSVLESRQT